MTDERTELDKRTPGSEQRPSQPGGPPWSQDAPGADAKGAVDMPGDPAIDRPTDGDPEETGPA